MAPPKTVVPSPPPRNPRYGLVTSVGGEAGIRRFMQDNPPETGPANRWELGFQFQPFDCAGDTDPFDVCNGSGVFNLDAAGLPDTVQYQPYGLWEAVKCTTASFAEVAERARLKLETSTSWKIEKELWGGAAAIAGSYPNPYLIADGTTLEQEGAAVPRVAALAALQEALGDCAQGSRGMVHATTSLVTFWQHAGLVIQEGGVLLDLYGNIIVAGAGYSGLGPIESDTPAEPGAGEVYAFATTLVNVRLSEITVHETVDPDNNNHFAVAQRVAAATWDQCCHIGVLVDLCSEVCTGDAGGSSDLNYFELEDEE